MWKDNLAKKILVTEKVTCLLIIETFNFIFGTALYRESSSQIMFESFKDYIGSVLLKKSLSPSVLRRKNA